MQDTEFDFGHIELTAMFWCVMDFQFGGYAAGFSRRERFIEGSELEIMISALDEVHSLNNPNSELD
ncbi:hypothetical protein F4X86_04800 [Candidatus Saccharibacteria bacterium]|nr:hypothetical protein [Candidatus Saccharibacteria bacterium]